MSGYSGTNYESAVVERVGLGPDASVDLLLLSTELTKTRSRSLPIVVLAVGCYFLSHFPASKGVVALVGREFLTRRESQGEK